MLGPAIAEIGVVALRAIVGPALALEREQGRRLEGLGVALDGAVREYAGTHDAQARRSTDTRGRQRGRCPQLPAGSCEKARRVPHSAANGLLTPSLKTKRQPVLARHAELIDALESGKAVTLRGPVLALDRVAPASC